MIEMEIRGKEYSFYNVEIEERCRKFFIKRFNRQPEKDKGYYNEWLQRFYSGMPDRFMDINSLEIYLSIIAQERVNCKQVVIL